MLPSLGRSSRPGRRAHDRAPSMMPSQDVLGTIVNRSCISTRRIDSSFQGSLGGQAPA
jgi:hypothetical protein